MSHILNLVSEDEADALNSFIDNGISKIKTNKVFCDLSLSDFVQFVLDGDISGKVIDGLIRTLITMRFEPDSTQLLTLESYREILNELLENYIEQNRQKVVRGWRQHISNQFNELEITNFENRQLSHY